MNRRFPCPNNPTSGLRRAAKQFEDCASPHLCDKHGCQRVPDRAPIVPRAAQLERRRQRINRLLGIERAPPANDTAWLIERNIGGPPQWLHYPEGSKLPHWTTDANEALRFQTDTAADRHAIMQGLYHQGFKVGVTEHAWMNAEPKTCPTPADATVKADEVERE